MLGFVGIDAGTAVGIGILSAVASIRWAGGKWEKSKKRWWQNWSRVSEGLDRDLKVCHLMSPFLSNSDLINLTLKGDSPRHDEPAGDCGSRDNLQWEYGFGTDSRGRVRLRRQGA